MQTLLSRNSNRDLRAYFIWAPYLRADTVEMARVGSNKFSAPNAGYFWMPSDRLARELALALRLPVGRLAWDVYLLYEKGTAWEKTFPQPAYWQHQIGVIQGEPLNIPKFQSRIQELLKQ